MHFNTDEDRWNFIIENMKLVPFVCNKYWKGNYTEDHLQEGYLALVIATDNFDETKGIKFSTYASKCIWGRINFYRINDQLIRPIRHQDKHGEEAFSFANVVSLDFITHQCDDGDDITLEKTLSDNNHTAYDMEYQIYIEDFCKRVLTERQAAILKLKVSGFTIRQMEQYVGVSRTIISKEVKRIKELYNKHMR